MLEYALERPLGAHALIELLLLLELPPLRMGPSGDLIDLEPREVVPGLPRRRDESLLELGFIFPSRLQLLPELSLDKLRQESLSLPGKLKVGRFLILTGGLSQLGDRTSIDKYPQA